MERIKNFKNLLENYVGPDRSIVDTKVTNLTLPGENYMSDIIKINVILKNNNTAVVENHHLVAKLVINSDVVGTTADLTKSEILVYREIVPAIEDFQKRHGVMITNFFPKYIAGRFNLSGSDEADEDAVIVLEDLTEQGYKNIDRHVGFDMDGAKLILKDMAVFHAVPLSLRLLEPETYKSKISKNTSLFLPDFAKDKMKEGPDLSSFLIELFKSDEKYLHLIPAVSTFLEMLKEQLQHNPEQFFTYKPETKFETLTHEDMWLNNTMQICQDGKLIKNMFVDFQMVRSNTLFNDIIFFLVSSVQLKCLQENFDELVQFYYENFANTLKLFGCYSEEYSYENFLKAFPKECKKGLIQCTFMIITVIFNQKGKAIEESFAINYEEVPSIAKEKVGFIYLEAVKRGWLS